MMIQYLKKVFTKVYYGVENYINYVISLIYIYKNKKRVQKKINNDKVLNVIFLIQYIPGWNKLEPIYLKMKKDKRFNPIIVCVPLNIQNNTLINKNAKNDTYEYFNKQGYKVINSLRQDGSWYELKQLKPDYVFHSRPYNMFMPKCYTSKKIRKNALICNVLYGVNITVN